MSECRGRGVLQFRDNEEIEMSEAAMDRVLSLLTEVRYDLCVLTGDYRAKTWGPYEAALSGVARVRALPLEGPAGRGSRGFDLASLGFSSRLVSLADPSLVAFPNVQVGSFTTLSDWDSGDGGNLAVLP